MRVPHICKPVTPPPPSLQYTTSTPYKFSYHVLFVNLFSLFFRFRCVNTDGEVSCP